jgi:hypothetical protein
MSVFISTEKDQITSPLLRLPAELRNIIWNYTFSNETLNVAASIYDRPPLLGAPPSVIARPAPNVRGVRALIYTCQQVHYEASSLIFSNCIVDITAYHLLDTMGVRSYPMNTFQKIIIPSATTWFVLRHPENVKYAAAKMKVLTHVYVDAGRKTTFSQEPASRVVSILRMAFLKSDLEVVHE